MDSILEREAEHLQSQEEANGIRRHSGEGQARPLDNRQGRGRWFFAGKAMVAHQVVQSPSTGG